jgi:hypothetical protein
MTNRNFNVVSLRNSILIKNTIKMILDNILHISFEELEIMFTILNIKIDCKTYLVMMSRKILKEESPEDIFTEMEDLINTACFIHLGNLIKKIDEKIRQLLLSKSNSNFKYNSNPKSKIPYHPLELSLFWKDFEHSFIKGHYDCFYTNHTSYILSREFRLMQLDNAIIFPRNFICWNEMDLIESGYDYYNLSEVYDDSLYSIIHNKIYSYVNIHQLGGIMKCLFIYYYMSLSKERLSIYEEELIQETWKPSRVISFCLTEDEKMDIEMID